MIVFFRWVIFVCVLAFLFVGIPTIDKATNIKIEDDLGTTGELVELNAIDYLYDYSYGSISGSTIFGFGGKYESTTVEAYSCRFALKLNDGKIVVITALMDVISFQDSDEPLVIFSKYRDNYPRSIANLPTPQKITKVVKEFTLSIPLDRVVEFVEIEPY